MTIPATSWRIALKNFTQIVQEILKVRVEIHLIHKKKDDFKETCARSTTASRKLL
jgi:hypothetical protein